MSNCLFSKPEHFQIQAYDVAHRSCTWRIKRDAARPKVRGDRGISNTEVTVEAALEFSRGRKIYRLVNCSRGREIFQHVKCSRGRKICRSFNCRRGRKICRLVNCSRGRKICHHVRCRARKVCRHVEKIQASLKFRARKYLDMLA